MAITPINPRAPKKDAMDKILQGLQIANEVFKIPVAYEQIRKYRADADLARDAQQGITTKSKLGESGVVMIPQSERDVLMPDQAGPPAPLMPAPDYYGPKPTTYKVREGDQVSEVMGTSAESKDKFFDSEKSLRGEYEGHAITKASNGALSAGEAAIRILGKKNALGSDDFAGLYKFVHTIEPQSMVKEGEFDTASRAAGMKSQLSNLLDQFKSGTRFSPEARANMVSTVKDLIAAQLSVQGKIDSQYRGMAQEQGFKPGNIVTGFWTKKEEPKPVLPSEQHSRLQELRKKRDEGTLGK